MPLLSSKAAAPPFGAAGTLRSAAIPMPAFAPRVALSAVYMEARSGLPNAALPAGSPSPRSGSIMRSSQPSLDRRSRGQRQPPDPVTHDSAVRTRQGASLSPAGADVQEVRMAWIAALICKGRCCKRAARCAASSPGRGTLPQAAPGRKCTLPVLVSWAGCTSHVALAGNFTLAALPGGSAEKTAVSVRCEAEVWRWLVNVAELEALDAARRSVVARACRETKCDPASQ